MIPFTLKGYCKKKNYNRLQVIVANHLTVPTSPNQLPLALTLSSNPLLAAHPWLPTTPPAATPALV